MRRKTRIGPSWLMGLLVPLALLLAACSSPAPNFNISLSPTSLTVQQGASGSTTLTLTPQHGFSGTVYLRLRVRNVPTQFDLLPNQLEVAGGRPFDRRLAIYPTTNPPNTYQLTLEARARSGGPLRTVDFTVVVTPP